MNLFHHIGLVLHDAGNQLQILWMVHSPYAQFWIEWAFAKAKDAVAILTLGLGYANGLAVPRVMTAQAQSGGLALVALRAGKAS